MAEYTTPPAGTVPVRLYLQALGLPDDLIRWNEQAQMVQIGNQQLRPDANIGGRTWASPAALEQAARQATGGQLPSDNPFAPPNPALGLMRAVAAASQMAKMLAPLAESFRGMPITLPQIQAVADLTGKLPTGAPTFAAREAEAARQLQERIARINAAARTDSELSPSLQFSIWRYFDELGRESSREAAQRADQAAADAAQTFGISKAVAREWQALEPFVMQFRQQRPSGMSPDTWERNRQQAYNDLVRAFANIKARYALTDRDARFLDAMWAIQMGDQQAQEQARKALTELASNAKTIGRMVETGPITGALQP